MQKQLLLSDNQQLPHTSNLHSKRPVTARTHPNDHRLAPATVGTLQGSTHDSGVANTLKPVTSSSGQAA
jgi:hypothetical protein